MAFLISLHLGLMLHFPICCIEFLKSHIPTLVKELSLPVFEQIHCTGFISILNLCKSMPNIMLCIIAFPSKINYKPICVALENGCFLCTSECIFSLCELFLRADGYGVLENAFSLQKSHLKMQVHRQFTKKKSQFMVKEQYVSYVRTISLWFICLVIKRCNPHGSVHWAVLGVLTWDSVM